MKKRGIVLSILILLTGVFPPSDASYTIISNFFNYLLNLSKIGPALLPLYRDVKPSDVYDFIVVGAGPSGSVIANRLSKVPSYTVLLLEAGKEPSFVTDIPLICAALQFTDYDWGYRAEPQDGFCRGCIDKRMNWPHGKALGGTTVINFMIYVRGNKIDYDRWSAMGNPGWSYDDVLPFFKKSEDAHIAVQDTEYHNKGGYLSVSDIPYRTKVVDAFVSGAQQAGHPYVDYNGKNQLGVSYIQTTTINGKRCSAEKAFLRPIRDRRNLDISMDSRVTKILIDPVTKEAYGVNYFKNGRNYTAYARKEVILSAGGLNSPQLLMLSGIGPKTHLQELGIPLVKDLPVGMTMYDHACFVGVMFRLNESVSFDLLKAALNPLTYFQYTQGKGILTSIGTAEALTYLRTNASQDPDPKYPDMELIFAGGGMQTDFGLFFRKMFNIPEMTYKKIWKDYENKPVYQAIPMLIHPKSKGYIKLRSSNAFDPPKFYANYLSDPENHDVKTFIAAIRAIQEINASPALQKYGATIVRTPIPGCERHHFDSDRYWECALRMLIGSLYHQVATCKMGPSNDTEAVVDSKLRVYGIKKLRVADTSVIPLTLSAHTMAPSYMIGEKAADMIRTTWRLLPKISK